MYEIYKLLITTLICFAGFFSYTLRSDNELTYRAFFRDLGMGATMAAAVYGYAILSGLLLKELIIAAGCSTLCLSYLMKLTKIHA